MGRKSNADRIVEQLANIAQPVGGDSFVLPNHSGIKNHAETTGAFLRKDQDDTTPFSLTVGGFKLESNTPVILIQDTNSTGNNAQATFAFQDELAATLGTFGYTVPTSPDFWITNSQVGGDINLFPSGDVVINSSQIKSVADPTAAQDAATKKYVDTQISPVQAELDDLSGAYVTHTADSSDPHGANIIQSHMSLTSGAITGDMTQSGAAYIPNIVYNTTSGGITASNYPKGTLLVIYTA